MARDLWNVFFACVIGAGLGTLVALEVSNTFWWLGLIAGGFTGYVLYDWRAILAAIPPAYRAARGYRFPTHFWRNLFTTIGWSGFFVANMVFYVLGIFVWTNGIEISRDLFVVAFMYLLPFGTLIVSGLNFSDETMPMRRMAVFSFPLAVFFWRLPRGMWWVAKRIPGATMATILFLGHFGWQLFLRVHSEMRLLCGVDALLGAAVGYYFGSVLAGAAAGGLLGVINYALVTELWLKRAGYLPLRV